MMRRSSAFIACSLLIALFLSALAFAQKPSDKPQQKKPQPAQQDDQTTKVTVYEVRLPVVVKEKGKFVPGLTKNNFEIYEDGKRQTIETFIAPSKLPLDIAVLMDTSNSVKLKLPFEKDAAEDFVATVTTYRRKDQVHLLDMMGVGLIDESWCQKLPQQLADRLKLLIDTRDDDDHELGQLDPAN